MNKYFLKYSLVLITKSKKPFFITEDLIKDTTDKIQNICNSSGIDLLSLGFDKDHLHLEFSANPYIKLDKLIHAMKTKTNAYITKKYKQHVKEIYKSGSIWAKDYCISTSSGIPLDVIRQHLEMEKFDK